MGYVYLLINPSFREDWVKIGKTHGGVEMRCEELSQEAGADALRGAAGREGGGRKPQGGTLL